MVFSIQLMSQSLISSWPIYFLLMSSVAEGGTNFTDCRIRFLNKVDDSMKYVYQGLLYDDAVPKPEDREKIISLQGCKEFCGSGIDYYSWREGSRTMTTYVVSVVGFAAQAPYESNQFWSNLYALIRWIGSPIASLCYTLWNIKVNHKAALLLDMSADYRSNPKRRDINEDLRDSLFLLTVANQYTFSKARSSVKLLRIALFFGVQAPEPSVRPENMEKLTGLFQVKEFRKDLTTMLRDSRRRGVVPLYFTLVVFIVALIWSIQDAFGDVGANAVAHDLAIGLLLAWVPVLIFSAIVDRNPILAEAGRDQLNQLLHATEIALQDEETREALYEYVKLDSKGAKISNPDTVSDTSIQKPKRYKSKDQETPASNTFFQRFAGQGRIRWHYGIAHHMLRGIESQILKERQTARNWLSIPEIDRKLIGGPEDEVELYRFDAREEFWQILSALVIVAGSLSGAFVISYHTPTVGLGCRSGGYMIFYINTLAVFACEIFVWIVMDRNSAGPLHANDSPGGHTNHSCRWAVIINWLLRFLELVNAGWLIYIVAAQTFGSYRNCECQSSTWGRWGGYIDFSIYEFAPGVEKYWLAGTSLSLSIMATTIVYLTFGWCIQSHLNTVDLSKALRGLDRTRRFKKYTIWIRRIPEPFLRLAEMLLLVKREKGVVWHWRTPPQKCSA